MKSPDVHTLPKLSSCSALYSGHMMEMTLWWASSLSIIWSSRSVGCHMDQPKWIIQAACEAFGMIQLRRRKWRQCKKKMNAQTKIWCRVMALVIGVTVLHEFRRRYNSGRLEKEPYPRRITMNWLCASNAWLKMGNSFKKVQFTWRCSSTISRV